MSVFQEIAKFLFPIKFSARIEVVISDHIFSLLTKGSYAWVAFSEQLKCLNSDF